MSKKPYTLFMILIPHRKIYIRLLIRYHPCHIWHSVLWLNLTYIWYFFCNCHGRTHPVQTSYIPRIKFYIYFLSLGSFMERIRSDSRLFCNISSQYYFYGDELLSSRPTHKSEDNSLPDVLCSYAHPEAVSIRNPRMLRGVVTGDLLRISHTH
jgi:hypothetical protein